MPGSHRNGIGRRFVRNADPESTQLTKIVGSDPPVDDSQFVAAPVAKGALGTQNKNPTKPVRPHRNPIDEVTLTQPNLT